MSELTTLEKLNKLTSKDAKHFILTKYNFWTYQLQTYVDRDQIELYLGEEATSCGCDMEEYVSTVFGKTFD